MNIWTKKLIKRTTSIIGSSIVLLMLSSVAFADSTHVAEKGETLYSISRKYQLTVAELRAANNMSENDVLKAGQKLIIPSADISTAVALSGLPSKAVATSETKTKKTMEYIVQKGDTFYGIARKNNINVSELLALNSFSSDEVLKAGQKILVPDASVSSGTTSVVASKTENTTTVNTNTSHSNDLPDLKSADPRQYKDGTTSDSLLVWPVNNPKVTYVKGKASGVQLSAKKDEAVTAIRAGTIMYCGVYRGFGQVIFVQSKTGLIYAYTGLGSVTVQKGDYVVSGTQIGTAGIDTISMQSQMTLMVFQNGMPIDPAKAPRG